MDRSTQKSLPAFWAGRLTIIPVVSNIPQKPQLSSTKIGMLKYVRRDFDFQSLRVVPDEDEDLEPVLEKEDVGSQGEVNGSAYDSIALQQTGEAWVAPEAVNYDGYITYIMKPLSSKTSYYTYYSAGVDSPMPNLQVLESAHSCEDSLNFRSKMYCREEKDRLCLPYEIRSAIYAYAFEGPAERGVQQAMLKTLPTVCRFLYVDIITSYNMTHVNFSLTSKHRYINQANSLWIMASSTRKGSN